MHSALALTLWLIAAPQGAPLPAPTPAAHAWPGTDASLERLWSEAERDAARKRPLALARMYQALSLQRAYPSPANERGARAALKRIARRPGFPGAHAAFWLGEVNAPMPRLLGPFAGLDRELPAEAEGGGPVQEQHYTLRWQPITPTESGFDLSPWSLPSGKTTAFLALSIPARRASSATLWLGANGRVSVYQDHEELASFEAPQASLDRHALRLALKPGDNQLLIRVSWEGGSERLYLRLSSPWRQDGARAPAGRPLVRGRRRGRIAQPTDAAALLLKRRRVPANTHALWGGLIAALGRYDEEATPNEVELQLREAIRGDPSAPLYRLQLAHRLVDRDPSQARALLRDALLSDPSFAPARLELARLAIQDGRTLAAKAQLERAIRDDPSLYAARLARARLGLFQLDEGARAFSGLPPSPQATLLMAEHRRMSLDLRGAARLAADVLEAEPGNREALLMLDSLYVHLDPLETQRLLSKLPAPPGSLAYGLWRVKLLASLLEDPQGAEAELAELAERFPFSAAVPARAAELKLWQGAPALAEIDRALKLSPNQASLRQRRRLLSKERGGLRDRFRADPRRLAALPKLKGEVDYGGAMLADTTALKLHADGSYTRYRQSVLRADKPLRLGTDGLLTFQGGREWLNVRAVQRVKPSGAVETLKHWTVGERQLSRFNRIYSGLDTLVAEVGTLQPGELLNIEYELSGDAAHELGDFFGDIQLPQAGAAFPSRGWHYTLIAPEARALSHSETRLPPPTEARVKGARETRWSLGPTQPLSPEVNGPALTELSPVLSISSYQSWEDLGRWFGPRYAQELPLSAALKAKVASWTAGAKTPREKALKLYEEVVKHTRYVGVELGAHGWIPSSANRVYAQGHGDCKDKSTLLVALLREAGVPAGLTLVRTFDRGLLPSEHPTMWAFNHAIVYVPGLDLFLDPTAEFNGSKELPAMDQGAMALVVYPDGRVARRELPASAPSDNQNNSDYLATLGKEGSLKLEGTERFVGQQAADLRRRMQERQGQKKQLEQHLAGLLPGAKVTALQTSKLSALEAPVSYTYTVKAPRYGQPQPGGLSVPASLFQHQLTRSYAPLPSRESDLVLSHAWRTNNRLEYRLPAGAHLLELPPSVKIDSKYLSFEQTITKTERGFIVDDTVTIKARRVPAAAYGDFRRAALAADRAMSRKVVIAW